MVNVPLAIDSGDSMLGEKFMVNFVPRSMLEIRLLSTIMKEALVAANFSVRYSARRRPAEVRSLKISKRR